MNDDGNNFKAGERDGGGVRAGQGPQNTAMLRNLTIPLLTGSGTSSRSEAVRRTPYETFPCPLGLLQTP